MSGCGLLGNSPLSRNINNLQGDKAKPPYILKQGTGQVDHPKGQTLYITDGIGLVATRDEVREIRPGDVVHIERARSTGTAPPRTGSMAHVAIQEADASGQVVTPLDHVTGEEYRVR